MKKLGPSDSQNQNQIHPSVWPGQANQGQTFSSYSLSSSIQSNRFTPSLPSAYHCSLFDLAGPPLRFHSSEDIPSSTFPKTEKGKMSNSVTLHFSKYPWSETVVVNCMRLQELHCSVVINGGFTAGCSPVFQSGGTFGLTEPPPTSWTNAGILKSTVDGCNGKCVMLWKHT